MDSAAATSHKLNELYTRWFVSAETQALCDGILQQLVQAGLARAPPLASLASASPALLGSRAVSTPPKPKSPCSALSDSGSSPSSWVPSTPPKSASPRSALSDSGSSPAARSSPGSSPAARASPARSAGSPILESNSPYRTDERIGAGDAMPPAAHALATSPTRVSPPKAAAAASPPGTPPGTTWVVRAQVCDDDPTIPFEGYCDDTQMIQKYMSSLYWSLTTLIKTPWVHPDTILEKVFASVIVITGAIFFAAILGNITAMINSFDKSNAQLRDVMSTLHRLIAKYDVPTKLQKRVFMYVQTQWSTTKGLDNQRILAKVPPALRGDILEAIYADLLQASPLFQNFSIECVRVMLSKLHSEVCLAKETLLAPGQLCSEVFIVVRGVLRVTPSDDAIAASGQRKSTARKMLFRVIEKPGSLVGMRDPFEKDYRYPFQVVAVKQAQLLVLSAKDLLDVFAMDNRNDIEVICDVLDKEFNDVNNALVKSQDAPGARRSSASGAAARRRSSGNAGSSHAQMSGMSDHEEVHARIGVIEETLRLCDNEISSIQEHLQLLPRLCQLLNIPNPDGSPSDSAAANGGKS